MGPDQRSLATSPSLLDGLRTQDPEAWRRLVTLYGPLVVAWCRQHGLQAADVEDVVQEVFQVVLRRVGDFRKERAADTFRGWLWTITRHKLGDHWRRKAAHPQAAGGSEVRQQLEQIPETESPASCEASSELTAGLYQRALDMVRSQFEETTWRAFLMVVCDNRRPADVAEDLRLSLNAVYLAKSRVLCALRETLGDATPDELPRVGAGRPHRSEDTT
jgi:RNA polymerase sigma-70 factor (ECF subfamily)